MPNLEIGYQERDPATKIISTTTLLAAPIGVRTLAEAAAILKIPIPELAQAARHVRPWLHADGRTRFWSVRQLARHVQLAREGRPAKRPAQERKLSQEDAEAAALLAESSSIAAAARSYGVNPDTVTRAWKRHGIPNPRRKRAA